MQTPSDLPGMTRYPTPSPTPDVKPFAETGTIASTVQKKTVVLATAAITEDNLFMNGLFQNIYVLYRMFESMGYQSYLLVNKKPASLERVPQYMKDLKVFELEEVVRSPIPVALYLEIGMSIEGQMRKFFRMCGAKIVKLYLGNILNIDIETPMFMPMVHFAHHIIGDLDEIWVSPHYYQHGQYARALNHVSVDKKASVVAPYVWDSQILTANGTRTFEWVPPEDPNKQTFLVLEPNISFQKCSLVPLMILETWFRKHPEWAGEVVVVNGERLLQIPFFKEVILPSMDLWTKERIKFKGRMDILSILKDYPSSIPICHQWNNEYNYMVLEYFYTGFPVLHNADDWSSYGYYYPNSDFSAAANLIDRVRGCHVENYQIYKAHAKALLWRHSPYNPDVHQAWAKCIKEI